MHVFSQKPETNAPSRRFGWVLFAIRKLIIWDAYIFPDGVTSTFIFTELKKEKASNNLSWQKKKKLPHLREYIKLSVKARLLF